MPAWLENIQSNFRLVDVLDIAIVAVFVYGVLRWLRQRATLAVLVVLSIVVALYAAARLFNLYLTLSLFQAGLTVVLLALVLVFQEDLRRAAERLAAWRPVGRGRPPVDQQECFDAVIEAAAHLAEERTGALIVFGGREPLERFVRGGVPLKGRLSVPLLLSLFDTDSPGHDGAVLIENERISRFGVHLPLTARTGEVESGGTRHAAALGLAESCDALVVVVSEERGTIGVAEEGRLEICESIAQLKDRLERHRRRSHPPDTQRPRLYRRLLEDRGSKLAAVGIACVAWLLFAYRVESVQRTIILPVEYRNLPEGWGLDEPGPPQARVTLSGSERVFSRLDRSSLVLAVDMSGAEVGPLEIELTEDHLELPAGLTVNQIEPRAVRVTIYRLRVIDLPIRVMTDRRTLPAHLELTAAEPSPASVRVKVRDAGGDAIEHVRTEWLDLSGVRGETTLKARLLFSERMQPVEAGTSTVTVRIKVQKRAPPEQPLAVRRAGPACRAGPSRASLAAA